MTQGESYEHSEEIELAEVDLESKHDYYLAESGDNSEDGGDEKETGKTRIVEETTTEQKEEDKKERKRLGLEGGSGIFGASFNFTNSILGAGLVGIPFAFSEAGLWLGLFLLLFMGVLNGWSVRLVVRCGKLSGTSAYPTMCRKAFGRLGLLAAAGSMAMFTFFACIAYTIIIGDTLPRVVAAVVPSVEWLSNRTMWILITTICVMLPLCLLKDISKLEYSSFMSIGAEAVLLVVTIIESVNALQKPGVSVTEGLRSFAEPNVFAGIGAISMAYVCHHNTFLLYNSLRKPTLRRFAHVTYMSVGFSAAVMTATGMAGAIAFQHDTKGNILNNFPDDSISANIARAALAMTMLFTYPLEIFVCRHALHAAICLVRPIPASMAVYRTIVVILVAIITLIGILVTNLGAVLELTGGLSGVLLGFVLPALCFLRLSKKSYLSRQKLCAIFLLIFGAISLVASTGLTLFNLATGRQRGQ
eukprot:gb/GECH01006381.1/.p1 GENE.gb/GECH01006381.1/~~gb/GECH01006381.1/.p1  ORF type:complete len:474 (+),score=57.58 gb/GECH01006381.1/:1-1422(+)